MADSVTCPRCAGEDAYRDGSQWICPACSHEWSAETAASSVSDTPTEGVRDANGNALVDGDSVIVIKDLKVKGSSLVVKGGTKVKSIRLVDGVDGHDISCRIDGVGAMHLKSEFVRKA